MSHDLCLLTLPKDADAETAMQLVAKLEAGSRMSGVEHDRHRLAQLLIGLDSRYGIYKKDYAEIGKLEGISVKEARDRDDSVELNGETNGKPLAQFIIYDDRIVVHWYSGTTDTEMNRYL